MGIELGGSMDARQQQILTEAENEFGTNAEFAYLIPGTKDFAIVTLAQAMAICGSEMVSQDPAILMATLKQWHERVETMQQKYPNRYSRSLQLGREALVRRGIS